MSGIVSVLNVTGGDIELRFDKSDAAERIRACRVVRDMLRRGYALLVEVERDGVKAFERALDFDETKGVYLIADYDPRIGEPVLKKETQDGASEGGADQAAEVGAASESESGKRRGRPRKELPAESTRAVAVSRSAGG